MLSATVKLRRRPGGVYSATKEATTGRTMPIPPRPVNTRITPSNGMLGINAAATVVTPPITSNEMFRASLRPSLSATYPPLTAPMPIPTKVSESTHPPSWADSAAGWIPYSAAIAGIDRPNS